VADRTGLGPALALVGAEVLAAALLLARRVLATREDA
jgi:hypothetical protein